MVNVRGKVAVVMPLLIKETWQASMTNHAIDLLHCCTDLPFELILPTVACRWSATIAEICDGFIPIEKAGSASEDINKGIDAARERDCKYVVYTGNDVFVRPGWLDALFECFEEHDDCGLATLASADLNKTPASIYFGQDRISEGVYGPFMMFDASWRFDADSFPGPFADSDLIMRMYEAELRMYRNNRVVIQHLNKQSMDETHETRYAAALDNFRAKHGNSGLLMYRILTEGWVL